MGYTPMNIQRYVLNHYPTEAPRMEKEDTGNWVTHQDHLAEVARLTAIIENAYTRAVRLDSGLARLSAYSDQLACDLNPHKENRE